MENKDVLQSMGISKNKANHFDNHEAISDYVNNQKHLNDKQRGNLINHISKMRNYERLSPAIRKALVDNNTNIYYNKDKGVSKFAPGSININGNFTDEGERRHFYHELYHNIGSAYDLDNLKSKTGGTLAETLRSESGDKKRAEIQKYLDDYYKNHPGFDGTKWKFRFGNTLQDIANGMNKFVGSSDTRQNPQYWKTDGRQAHELFAQLGELLSSEDGEEYYKVLKQLMPNSVSAFEEIMENIYG